MTPHAHTAGIPGLKHVPVPEDERRRVAWRDAAGTHLTGTIEWRALMGRELVAVLVREDRAPKRLARVSPNDLRDLGPAVPRIPLAPEPLVRLRVLSPVSGMPIRSAGGGA